MNSLSAANRVLSVILTGVALVAAALGLFEIQYLGFPDGYLSDWDIVRKGLLTGLIGISVFMSAAALFLGWRSVSSSASTYLRIAGLLYAVFLAAVLIADSYFRGQSGRGG